MIVFATIRLGESAATSLASPEKRLAAIEESNDGFYLAEIDLKLRGIGDLLGRRQSGQSNLQLIGRQYADLAELSQREALTLLEEDPTLALPEHYLLSQVISEIKANPSDIS